MFLNFEYGMIIDEFNPDMDINPYSPDMSSNHNGRKDIENGMKYSFGYYISNNVSVGMSYMNAKISGSNDVESYKARFNERNLFLNYDIFNVKKIQFFASVSTGRIKFSSQRSLVYDGSLIPGNCIDCNSKKYSYGGGVSTKLDDKIEFIFNISRNLVKHDGLDGWDYGSKSDQYIFRSFGIRLYLDK